MTRCYVDTSAAAKLLVEESETASLVSWLDDNSHSLVATHLLETELRRFATRHDLPQADVSEILARIDLYGLPPSLYREAGILPGVALRSLDALHLTAALRLEVDLVITYDRRFADAATDIGMRIHAPGTEHTHPET